MASDPLDDHVLARVELSRRELVRRLVVGTAFAVPVVASFDMASLSATSADALTTNGGPCPTYTETITGTVYGPLFITSGQSVLLDGATVTGAVKVEPGGALDAENATIGGSLHSNGATSMHMHGTSVGGSLIVSNSTGPVVIGGSDSCEASSAGNEIGAAARLVGNTRGVQFSDNTVGGSLTVVDNSGTVTVSNNNVGGATKVQ
jgi:hypothetical protein